MKVLLVDDSTILGDRVPRMISEIAPEIEIVGQAHSSSEVAESGHCDLIWRSWPSDGLEVLQDIKHNTVAPIVIVFTNYPFPQSRQRCLEGGAEFFFDKSSEFDSLRETIEHPNRDLRYSALKT